MRWVSRYNKTAYFNYTLMNYTNETYMEQTSQLCFAKQYCS